MSKYTFSAQNNFARVNSEPKKPFSGSISAKLVIRTSFLREASFKAGWISKSVPKTFYNILYV